MSKNKNYSDGQIISDIADDLNCSLADAKQHLDALKKVCLENVPAFEKFSIEGLFIAKIMIRKARKGRNMHTNVEIDIPEKRIIKYKAGKALADAIA